jgi:hypothetical protein
MIDGIAWDFDFTRSQRPLLPLLDSDLNGGDIDAQWTVLDLFGEEDYAEGGGASPLLGVHRETGQIFGLDVERESSQMFLLNSDADRFIRTFLLFDDVLRAGKLPAGDVAKRAREVDPGTFQGSEWQELAEYLKFLEDSPSGLSSTETYGAVVADASHCSRVIGWIGSSFFFDRSAFRAGSCLVAHASKSFTTSVSSLVSA